MDFGATMGTEDYVLQKWVSPPPEIEPDIRRTIDEVFDDLQYIGSDDPGLTARLPSKASRNRCSGYRTSACS